TLSWAAEGCFIERRVSGFYPPVAPRLGRLCDGVECSLNSVHQHINGELPVPNPERSSIPRLHRPEGYPNSHRSRRDQLLPPALRTFYPRCLLDPAYCVWSRKAAGLPSRVAKFHRDPPDATPWCLRSV